MGIEERIENLEQRVGVIGDTIDVSLEQRLTSLEEAVYGGSNVEPAPITSPEPDPFAAFAGPPPVGEPPVEELQQVPTPPAPEPGGPNAAPGPNDPPGDPTGPVTAPEATGEGSVPPEAPPSTEGL